MTWWGASRRAVTAATCAASLALTLASPCRSQTEESAEDPGAGAKATIGTALLGAESVLVVEAIFDVEPWWAYAVGGGAGAIGGAIGGYFIDQQNNRGLSMGLLVSGIVLAVPTTIAVLSATAYKVEENPDIEELATRVVYPRGPVAPVQPLTPAVALHDADGWKLAVPAVQISGLAEERSPRPRKSPRIFVPVLGMAF